jgi:hypothetical protein
VCTLILKDVRNHLQDFPWKVPEEKLGGAPDAAVAGLCEKRCEQNGG